MRMAYSLYSEDLKKRSAEDTDRKQKASLKRKKLHEINDLESKKAKMLADAAEISAEIEKSNAELRKL